MLAEHLREEPVPDPQQLRPLRSERRYQPAEVRVPLADLRRQGGQQRHRLRVQGGLIHQGRLERDVLRAHLAAWTPIALEQ
eukprot:2892280-Alexandrium_andersonii.AAC.1